MMMDKFWPLIDLIDWEQEDDEERLKPLVDFLAKGSEADICDFEILMSEFLYALDTKEHGRAWAQQNEGYLSSDLFLYTRCAVVVNGKEYFERILNNPDEVPADLEFEALLYVAMTAFEQKTGLDMDAFFDVVHPKMTVSYETGSNKEGWK